MALTRRARRTYRALLERYPYAHCELDFETPLQLLVATVLSAQTTDVMVNSVTPTLFSRWPTAEALAGADREEMEAVLRPTGFFRAKTNSVITLSAAIVERFDGEVPTRLEDLVTLPGVGRKTANVAQDGWRLGRCVVGERRGAAERLPGRRGTAGHRDQGGEGDERARDQWE